MIDRALARYAAVLKHDLRKDVSRIPGSAAAGGLGAGLLAFLRAKLVPGAQWVLSALDAERRIARADLVLTGEGKLDCQSFFGKAPVEIARYARRKDVPVAFLCGQMEAGLASKLKELGMPEVVLLSGAGEDIDRVMAQTSERLCRAAANAVGDFLCSTK
jgi:glycerate kinase